MNSASDLIGELFTEKGLHARSAVGELSLDAPVEVELVVELAGSQG